jgi:hypothetical protein
MRVLYYHQGTMPTFHKKRILLNFTYAHSELDWLITFGNSLYGIKTQIYDFLHTTEFFRHQGPQKMKKRQV